MGYACPSCGEGDNLVGTPDGETITVTCGGCGATWTRDPSPRCATCGRTDLQAVPLAIVEKGRGTQLSVVGTRIVHLCSVCDADKLGRYHTNRPNPLMPDALPTIGSGI